MYIISDASVVCDLPARFWCSIFNIVFTFSVSIIKRYKIIIIANIGYYMFGMFGY